MWEYELSSSELIYKWQLKWKKVQFLSVTRSFFKSIEKGKDNNDDNSVPWYELRFVAGRIFCHIWFHSRYNQLQNVHESE